jgi:hypothetical protein
MKLYLYCLTDNAKAAAIETTAGLSRSVTRVLDFGNIKAIVSDVESHRVKVTRENVLAHERVIDRVMLETTPLPFRFGAIVTVEQLQSYIESNEARLQALLDRVRGAVEMSVKIIWDKDAASAARTETTSQETDPKDDPPPGPGLAFLLAKQREMAGERELKNRVEEIARWLDQGVAGLVREKAVSLQPADRIVVSAAYLVERERVAEFKERVISLTSERKDLRFLTSGAWPPYSFTHLSS